MFAAPPRGLGYALGESELDGAQHHVRESLPARSAISTLSSDDCLSWGRVHRFRHHMVKPTNRSALPGILEANRARVLLGYGLGYLNGVRDTINANVADGDRGVSED